MSMSKIKATNEEFIRAWQKASSCAEVAQKLGLKIGQIRVRAWLLRTNGVPLKKMSSGGRPKADFKKLAILARSCAK